MSTRNLSTITATLPEPPKDVELQQPKKYVSPTNHYEKDSTQLEAESTKKSPRFYIAFVANCVSLLLATLDLTIVPGTLPAIAQDLQASSSQAYWVGAGYILAQAVSQTILGGLSESFGRKIMLQVSLGIFLIASILCSRANTIQWLIGARVMQGIGGGGIYTLTTMVVNDLTTLRERPKWMTVMSFAFALGNLGLVLGAGIAQHTTWRWIFYINIPVATFCLIALQFSLHLVIDTNNIREKVRGLDWPGLGILAGSLASLLLGLLSGGVSQPWDSAAVIVPLAVVPIGFIIFVAIEYFVSNPLVPVEMIRNRAMLVSMLSSFISGYCVTTVIYFLVVYFHGSTGYSVLHSSTATLPTLLLVPTGGIIGGAILSRTGDFRIPLIIGCAATAAGMGSLVTLSPTSTVTLQSGLQIPGSLGLGFIYISSVIAPHASLPNHQHSTGTNLVTLARALGQAFGIAIGAAIFQNKFSHYVTDRVKDGSLPANFVISGSNAESAFSVINTFLEQVREIYKFI
ncbi:major facilitator superfamily domain-containing protein [Xylogone sp. PMI_703]|nr:major facilitator superfamily domain-containing protein [Xylogone sp. PMI_703]